MTDGSYLNQSVVKIANDFSEEYFKRSSGDVVSPHVLKQNHTQKGVIKYFDRGLVPHVEHNEYESTVFLMQNEND